MLSGAVGARAEAFMLAGPTSNTAVKHDRTSTCRAGISSEILRQAARTYQH